MLGGTPVRASVLPYGQQCIEDDDIAAVVEALRSEWLTTGPRVAQFESEFAARVNAQHAVAVCNGTAALHAAMYALGIGPGDEVIVPSLTFAASANCVLYQGARPVFADVDAKTLLLDPQSVEDRITPRTRAIIAVDYAGQPCRYGDLQDIASRNGLAIVADAAHAVGASFQGRRVGSIADLTTFSFHPVKQITTGEGGVITTSDAELARKMRAFRNHGISSDARERSSRGAFFYEMTDLGFNYRITDVQCALGMSQLRKLDRFIATRQAIAAIYDSAIELLPAARRLAVFPDVVHAYHLYPILLESERLSADRGVIFKALRAEGIGVNVHYIPVHLHPYYVQRLGTHPGISPVAERAYERLITIPLHANMTSEDASDVVAALEKVLNHFAH